MNYNRTRIVKLTAIRPGNALRSNTSSTDRLLEQSFMEAEPEVLRKVMLLQQIHTKKALQKAGLVSNPSQLTFRVKLVLV